MRAHNRCEYEPERLVIQCAGLVSLDPVELQCGRDHLCWGPDDVLHGRSVALKRLVQGRMQRQVRYNR